MNTKQNAEFELLDALERIVHYYDLSKTWSSLPSLTVQAKSEHENTMFGAARTAIKKFREQPVKQSQLADASLEPVANIRTWHKNGDQHAELWNWDRGIESLPDGEHDLYTRPQAPATPLHGEPLTDEEIDDIWNYYCDEMGDASINDSYEIARAIEAKLKEKNT